MAGNKRSTYTKTKINIFRYFCCI